jgi:hypothetical protein
MAGGIGQSAHEPTDTHGSNCPRNRYADGHHHRDPSCAWQHPDSTLHTNGAASYRHISIDAGALADNYTPGHQSLDPYPHRNAHAYFGCA